MTTTLATKNAVGYVRVSSPGQTGERHSSLETQEARIREYCAGNSLVPVTMFTDVVSGRRDDRKEYRRMVDFLRAGGAQALVIQFLDRFGRNPKEILLRIWQLKENGITVVATDEDINDEMMLLIKAGITGQESKRTSERVRANMGRAVAKGVQAGRAPFGLRRIYQGKDVTWELDPVEAPIAKEMYRLAVEENLGFKAIADRLTEAGNRARGGRPFANFTIQRILTNEALMGTLAYGKRPRKGNPQQEIVTVPEFFPAILSNDEWDRLQERLKIRRESSRGSTHRSPYLLSGVARCGNCGGPMVGKVGAMRKGKRYRNYWRSRALRSREFCATCNGHAVAKLEEAVLEYLSQFDDPELVREHLEAVEKKDVREKEKELRAVRKGLSEIESRFLKRLDLLTRGVLTEAEFSKANESLRSQKEAFESQRLELEAWTEEQESKTSAAEYIPARSRVFWRIISA